MTEHSGVSEPPVSTFDEHFALAVFHEGAVVLDLVTGVLHTLNPVAAQICAALARGDSPAAAAEALASSFGIPSSTASQDVQALMRRLRERKAADDESAGPANPITFGEDRAGFVMRSEGERILRIHVPEYTVTFEDTGSLSDDGRATYLQWAAPHLLALQHQPVLHASAVRCADGVLAFCGASGAGKTTTSQLFAAQGARLVSEDLLILTLDRGVPAVFADGETALRRWVAEQSALPAARAAAGIDAGNLPDAVRGPALPLRKVLFLDPTRRSGQCIVTEPLPPVRAFVRLLENGFAELEQRGIWLELFAIARTIAVVVPCEEASVPDGLEALGSAVRSYNANSAS